MVTFGETFTSLRTLLTPFATTYTKVFFSSGGVVSWNLPAVSLVAVAAGVDDGAVRFESLLGADPSGKEGQPGSAS